MLKAFLSLIESKSLMQFKYLSKSLIDITIDEKDKLENLFEFLAHKGNTIDTIAMQYLKFTDYFLEEQMFFVLNRRYRYSTSDEISKLYNNREFMNNYTIGLGLSSYLWHTHRVLMKLFNKFLSEIRGERRHSLYFEIGPGHGEHFVTAMRNTNFSKYIGIDISETSAERTKEFIKWSLKENRQDWEILNKDFFDYEISDKPNAIVMGEVLEHVENPLSFLNKIYDISTNDTRIYISTAVNAPQLDHIYLFNDIDEVKNMFKKAKLEIIDMAAEASNFASIEKALQKKTAIVVAFILKKQLENN
ncbi:MAG: class I SAM-dependent methyltransferase [Endomicrobium sp.]|jgi:SAM-dependent methyltransferase|nr:class I SAM-dependent methyltransferase [Endomicrobium sp.]